MKLCWATDVHFNFMDQPAVERFCETVSGSGAAALLLGGDIAEATDLGRWLGFLDDRLDLPSHFVLGNHDYYKGTIPDVRRLVQSSKLKHLRWLPSAGIIDFGAGTGLIGHGGWGDARYGDFDHSPVILSDYLLIGDLRDTIDPEDVVTGFLKRTALKHKLESLGDEAAGALRPHLAAAVDFKKLIVLTHVPPFREACWYDDKISDDNYLPGFTCKAMGDLLLEFAERNPGCDLTVLCGHTHGGGYVRVRPNLEVFTGEAKYGQAYVRFVELEDGEVRVRSL